LVLGLPLPKGDRQKWIVEKAVELGVTRLTPLVTERSVATHEKHAGAKLGRYVIEASKQCGRNRLMEIGESQSWVDWLVGPAREAAQGNRVQRLIGHPGGRALSSLKPSAATPTYVAVGPEGGLSEIEVAAAEKAGWQLVDLGPRILRIETAAFALVGAVT